MKHFYSLFIITGMLVMCPVNATENTDAYEFAIESLIDRTSDTCFWNKVHAIEFLIDLGFNEIVNKAIEDELMKHENTPYKRIGYWRCLALNEVDNIKKNIIIDKIREVYRTPSNNDVIHAAESLAKLSSSLKKYPRTVLEDSSENNVLIRYDNWARILPVSKKDEEIDYQSLFKNLSSSDDEQRRIMAYGIKYLGEMNLKNWKKLYMLAIKEPLTSSSAVYLLSGTLASCPLQQKKQSELIEIRDKLKALANSSDKKNQYESYIGLGIFGCKEDLTFVQNKLLDIFILQNERELSDEEKDVLSAVSFAVLKLTLHKYY